MATGQMSGSGRGGGGAMTPEEIERQSLLDEKKRMLSQFESRPTVDSGELQPGDIYLSEGNSNVLAESANIYEAIGTPYYDPQRRKNVQEILNRATGQSEYVSARTQRFHKLTLEEGKSLYKLDKKIKKIANP